MEIKKNETPVDLKDLKLEIKLKAKNGIDFIFGAAITWFGIFLIWKIIPTCQGLQEMSFLIVKYGNI